MQLIRGINNLKSLPGSVVTIGNFDGMHLGHQHLIKKLVTTAKQYHVPAVLITFEPQPNEYFGKEPQPRLMRLREKWLALRASGIDYVFCLQFSPALARMSAQDFVKDILLNQLGMKIVIVGDDFRFGAKRQGDFALIQQLGKRFGFGAIQLPTFLLDAKRISSTRVRHALQEGDLAKVEQLLNRNYSLCGKVSYGDQRGRTLGFPTANIQLHRDLVPLTGVYAVRVFGIGEQSIDGVANIGIRPTFGGTRVLLEVHLFDFNQNIYGTNLQVEFLRKLRNEKRFTDFSELVLQIGQDASDAKAYFANLKEKQPA